MHSMFKVLMLQRGHLVCCSYFVKDVHKSLCALYEHYSLTTQLMTIHKITQHGGIAPSSKANVLVTFTALTDITLNHTDQYSLNNKHYSEMISLPSLMVTP